MIKKMIGLENMIVTLSDGTELGLERPAKNVFISHAHTDHLVSTRNRKLIASKETRVLANLSGEDFKHKDIRLIHAGHILGAKQAVIETDGEKIVYTGDIQIKDNIIVKGAEIEEADHIIIDRTYLDKVQEFPDPFEVYEEIYKWIKENEGKNILLGANRMGKAQEIIKYLNEYGIAPVVDQKVREITEKYNKLGIRLDIEDAENINGPFVAIVPLNIANYGLAKKLSIVYERKTLVGVATGLTKVFNYRVHKTFALSNHAGSKEIREYIELSNAKTVSYL